MPIGVEVAVTLGLRSWWAGAALLPASAAAHLLPGAAHVVLALPPAPLSVTPASVWDSEGSGGAVVAVALAAPLLLTPPSPRGGGGGALALACAFEGGAGGARVVLWSPVTLGEGGAGAAPARVLCPLPPRLPPGEVRVSVAYGGGGGGGTAGALSAPLRVLPAPLLLLRASGAPLGPLPRLGGAALLLPTSGGLLASAAAGLPLECALVLPGGAVAPGAGSPAAALNDTHAACASPRLPRAACGARGAPLVGLTLALALRGGRGGAPPRASRCSTRAAARRRRAPAARRRRPAPSSARTPRRRGL